MLQVPRVVSAHSLKSLPHPPSGAPAVCPSWHASQTADPHACRCCYSRLPTVFLCRSDGTIGWHGHPLDAKFEDALAKAVRADQREKLADANKPKPGKVLSGKKAKSLRHR